MKINLIGTQCVGKTTVIDNLKEEYKTYVIKEVIRTAAKEISNIKYNEQGDAASQETFFSMYENMFKLFDNYISDRGLIDVCAYTKWLCCNKGVDIKIYNRQLSRLIDFVKKNPDVIYVYFPIQFDAIEDGFRSTNESFRREIDDNFKEIIDILNSLSDVDFKIHVLESLSVEDRVKEVESLIK